MSLLAGLAFAFVRTGLAFFPRVALYHDTKKIAAVCALTLCLFYLFVSGASVPAQRAFVMIAIALTAVLLNRRAISVTSIGWAAFFLLLFRPEALLSIGFQLSFAAVAAIVCAAEAAVNRYTRLSAKKEGVGFYLLSCFTGVCLTTLIASVATAPFTMFHFSRLPVHALIGNLLCSAAVGFWVMPCLTAAALTMPFGWESPLLVLAGYGIGFINRAAMFTANLPHAVADFPPMPFWGLIAAGAAAAAAVLIAAVRSGRPVRALLASAAQGLCALGAMDLAAAFTSVSLGAGWFTVGVSAVLGLPGVIGLLLLRLILPA